MVTFAVFCSICILLMFALDLAVATSTLVRQPGNTFRVVFQFVAIIIVIVLIFGILYARARYFNRMPEYSEERILQIEKDIFELKGYHQQN